MLKRLRNECVIQLDIDTDGPILIKSGQTFATGVDMTAVRTWRNGDWEIFIPGSSLKGALRAQAERIARTLAPNGHGCCDPFFEAKNNQQGLPASCSSRFHKMREDSKVDALEPTRVYSLACPICKLFGCLSMSGRLAFNDAYLAPTNVDDWASDLAEQAQGMAREQLTLTLVRAMRNPSNLIRSPVLPVRSNVGIDRYTGKVASGPFDMETVSAARFSTILYLRNFELWQLGLLAFVLRDLRDGLIKLGMGKSRGLGRVQATVKQVEIRYLGLQSPPAEGALCELHGMRGLEGTDYGFWDQEKEPVKLYSDDNLPDQQVTAQSDSYGLRTVYKFNEQQCDHLWRRVAAQWITYARDNPHARQEPH